MGMEKRFGPSRHERRRLERKLLQASATGRLSRVLHLLRKHGERYCRKRKRRGGGGGGSSQTPSISSDEYYGDDDDCDAVGGSSSHAASTSKRDAHSMPESGSDTLAPDRRKVGKKEAYVREALRMIDVNCRDAEGFTPLHHACYSGSEELVQFLLSEKVDFSVEDEKGNTPLHIAARLGFAAIISLLREAGGDMEAPNAEQITPMNLVYERLRKKQKKLEEKEKGFSRSSRFHGPEEWGSRLVEEEQEEWSNGGNWWTGGEWGEQQERDADEWRHTDWNAAHWTWEDDEADFHQLGTKRKKGPKDRLEGGLLKERDEKRKRALEEKNREAQRILAEEEAKDRAWRERVLRQKDADLNKVYEQSWKGFEDSCNLCLSFASVPFPVEEGKEGDLARVIFHQAPLLEHKKLLRKEVLRWHPDKFLQKWGSRLKGPDHGRILARVNEISQALHQLYSSL